MRWEIRHGDCLEVLAAMPENSIEAIVTDPPYGLEFMGRTWDSMQGNPIDPGFLHWFAGFTDGEGCFSVHKKNVNGYETYDCQFSISLRADDRPILERIHRTLGIGTLSKPTAHATGDDNPKARYSVSAKAQLCALRDIFRAFPLRAKKARDFELWSDALDAWLEHEPGEWAEMAEARAALMATREYADDGIRVDPYQFWAWRWARQALRVAKPGAHLLAFGGTRTFHRLTCAIEDAGWEIRDCLSWLYGSGFPKSLDVSKAIDRAAGAERATRVNERWAEKYPNGPGGNLSGDGRSAHYSQAKRITEPLLTSDPATDLARLWQGWGTALKPAWEPIILARKPLAGTVAANVERFGTGALNVDACRIEGAYPWRASDSQQTSGASFSGGSFGEGPHPAGRWPANVALDQDAAAILDEQSGESRSGASGYDWRESANDNPTRIAHNIKSGIHFGDSGGASRFFYTAKASRWDRNEGLPDGARSSHPTVKPTDLMRWLVRLVTPPGGTVLDPFAGSGSTGVAALGEGFNFIGIERESEYVEIARARIAAVAPLLAEEASR